MKIISRKAIKSSDDFYDWYEDRESVIKGIAKLFDCPKDIASTIYTWYKYEDAFEDFESLDEFLDYVTDDIYDMIDACDDEDLKHEVLDSIESSYSIEADVAIKPYASDENMMMFYVGPGYPSHKQIREYAKSKGHKYIYWGTDESSRLKGFYNGDTLVTYIDPDELKGGYREDAEKFGEPIEFSQSIESSVYYPSGNVVPEDSVDMDIYLDYYFGTDRDKDNSHYTDEEKQRSVDYWFKKHEPEPDIIQSSEYADDLDETIEDFISQLESDGVDINDDADILQELGANYGYTAEDQQAILDEIHEFLDGNYAITSAEEHEDDLEQVDQEFTSKDTSINSSKLPAIYRLVQFPKGSVVLDFGGGRFDNGIDYLESIGCKGYVYDPYNRDAEYNRATIRAIRENGGADIVLNSNVLNVIKEPEARINVLKNLRKLVKPSGTVYITVYEGKGTGEGKQSQKDSYQLNRKTADYMEEIQSVFPDAIRKGKLIVANPTGYVTAAYNMKDGDFTTDRRLSPTSIRYKGYLILLDRAGDGYNVYDKHRELEDSGFLSMEDAKAFVDELVDYEKRNFSSTDVSIAPYKINEFIKELGDELYNVITDVLAETFGIDFVSDFVNVGVERTSDGVVAEVRAELDYEGMDSLAKVLDPVIQKYDKDAYFDMVDVGIMEAFLRLDLETEYVQSSVVDEDDSFDDRKEYLYDFDSILVIEEDGDLVYFPDEEKFEPLEDEEYNLELADGDTIAEDIADLIEYLPNEDGRYHVKGVAHFFYDLEGLYAEPDGWDDGGIIYDAEDVRMEYDPRASYVDEFEITRE